MSGHNRYDRVVAALVTAGAGGLSTALAGALAGAFAAGAHAEGTAAVRPPTEAAPVGLRLQAIRDAVSAVDVHGQAEGLPTTGAHGSLADPDLRLAWWANGNGRGWGNGGRGWGNGRGPVWGNGGWHNWGNGGHYWRNW